MQKRIPNKKETPINGQKLEDKQIDGEIPEQAIKREVKEELGIDIKDSQIKCINIFKDIEGKRFCYNYIFNVNYKKENIKNNQNKRR